MWSALRKKKTAPSLSTAWSPVVFVVYIDKLIGCILNAKEWEIPLGRCELLLGQFQVAANSADASSSCEVRWIYTNGRL